MIAVILSLTSTAVATPLGVVARCPWYSPGTIFGINLLAAVAIAGLVLAVLALLKMKKENVFLTNEVQKVLNQYGNIKQRVETLEKDLATMKQARQAYTPGPQPAHPAKPASVAPRAQAASASPAQPAPAAQRKPAAQPKIVKYGTPLMPDTATGRLKFAVRSLHDSSDNGLFKLELDSNGTTGTYHINPNATTQIMNDLQLFQNFVAPFTVSGSIDRARIKEVKEGTLVKEGSSWVVERRLTVTF